VRRATGGEAVIALLVIAAAGVGVAAIASVRGRRSGRREPCRAPEPESPATVVEVPEPAAEPSVLEPPTEGLEPPEARAPVGPPEVAPPVHNRYYDEPTCQAFVAGLSEDLLVRAQPLFEALARDGAVTARELAAQLHVEPSQLPGLLITPLRRRSDQLDLPLPFEVSRLKGSKLRQWEDSGGVAARMKRAIERSSLSRAAQP